MERLSECQMLGYCGSCRGALQMIGAYFLMCDRHRITHINPNILNRIFKYSPLRTKMSLVAWMPIRSGLVMPVLAAFALGTLVTTTILQSRYGKSQPLQVSTRKFELLMIGPSAKTYKVHDSVLKMPGIDDDALITQGNIKSMSNEASVYLILGRHPRIAECLYISHSKDLIILKYYPHGNLKAHLAKTPSVSPLDLRKWARQMIEGVAEIHRNGIRNSDLRLDQWLLDENLDARLSDFNASGFDANEQLGLQGSKSVGLEAYSHFLPRDLETDSTVRSDLFALGSSLYELEVGDKPFSELEGETITEQFDA